MAAGVAGVGLSWPSKLARSPNSIPPSLPPSSRSSRRRVVKMAISVDERKKNFTLQKSEEAFNAAKELMPGGVNSPVRAFKSVGGQPIVFDSVKGSHMWDIDGNEYIDYEYFGITPDLTTLGKIIGGGLPVGAYGGKRDIMEMVAPAGPMYQAGTLSGNPLAMTAGIHTLKRLKQPGNYQYLDKITSELVQGIIDAAKRAGHAICGGSIYGMFGFFFTEGPVYEFADAKKSDTAKFAKFFRGMLEEGVYFAPSQFEAGFTSLAHTSEDIQQTIEAAEKVLRQL
ncbi:Glutamate-1-semialdehyde 2,1-aminomutase [Actinidia chinensis var. chinensis]|uniref:Glutamate-1-semialdehyde 2,1-aminomutase n=1 Tax=Actinidia chinensis var. chinensis TaxID=1590841 RepID=A0A2R6PUT0_ACTCC|nr:Glutamate-1-semialdehyde 2,1-aminomutase [Actinidia chinensis var. chinensis]